MKTNRFSRATPRGVTSLDVLVVIATVALLVVVFQTVLQPRRQKGGHPRTCVSNLKQVSYAFRVWANDHAEKFPWEVSPERGGVRDEPFTTVAVRTYMMLSNELNTPKVLVCPQDRQRVWAKNWRLTHKNVSYFVGLDATTDSPAALLSGDRNLVGDGQPLGPGRHALAQFKQVQFGTNLHNRAGRIGFADGSVLQASETSLQQSIESAIYGGTTNLFIAVP